jgi:uncharacterized protein (DUF1684 family)
MTSLRKTTALILVATCTAFAADDAYRAEIEKDRRDTDAFLRSARSPLQLVGRFRIEEGSSTLGSDPAATIVLPAKAPQHVGTITRHGREFIFQPARGVSVSLNDKAISGSVAVQAVESPQPTDHVSFGDYKFGIRPMEQNFSLLLSDVQSPYIKAFTGAVWFPIDRSYRVTAHFTPAPEKKTVLVPFTDGGAKTFTLSGDLSFELGGQTLHLKALTPLGEERLFIMFQDQTSGKETYGGGRFLETDAAKDGKVILDFNKAANPYCAYNPYSICAVPLKENRLTVAIRAGEKHTSVEH